MARKSWALAAVGVVALVVAGAVQASVGGGAGNEASTAAASAVARDALSAGPSDAVVDSAISGSAASPAFSGKAEIAPVPPGGGGQTPVVPGSPRVVRSADVRVKVAEGSFGAAFDRVASVAAANGGFVSSSTTASVDDARSGVLTVRVPADRFDTVRLALGELGEIESQSIRGEDVSGQLVDFEARLRSLEAQEASLLTLVGKATAVGEVLQVQSTLFNVRQQIEQLKAQKANLDQSVSLSTLQVSLFEPGAAGVVRPVDDGPSLARSVDEAVDGMVSVVGGMIVVVGYLVPIGVLGLVVWGASRVLRRRPEPAAPAV
ncbi:MAG: DUF4349 domain-containing protein [Acidimicrobiales bacterium]